MPSAQADFLESTFWEGPLMQNIAVASEDPADRDLSARLSARARSVWAKFDRDPETSLSLHRHLADSAAVAGHLWDQWLPQNVKDLIALSIPGGVVEARLLAVWLAGTHDIGKATPAFACQADLPAQAMRDFDLEIPLQQQFGDDRRIAPHGLAGQVLLRDWLIECHGWTSRAAGAFTVIAGGHHGVPPGFAQIHDFEMHPELLRTPGPSKALWKAVQWELLDACAVAFGVVDRLPLWKSVRLSQQAQVLLTGIVIAADWIASDPALFPYHVPGGVAISPAKRVASAWAGLNLPSPWAPGLPAESVEELFASRFDLPKGAQVRPVQREAVRLARELSAPGLLVIEAPMGEGKTEAALIAAEIFAARSGAGGCFVALPTRATSNAMFPRVLAWLRHLPGDTDLSVHLAHGKAALDETFANMMHEAAPISAIDLDALEEENNFRRDVRKNPAELVAHQWLRGRKKGMLASFCVGTIDQLLFAGLKSRHLVLRHLALAGKVVIIDEVHAYDAYMNVYLERVLSWLGAYRVPVVMLSATLPADRRRALIEAYSGASTDALPASTSNDYPLLTAAAPGSDVIVVRAEAAADRRVEVLVEPLDDDPGALAERLASELADGGCALVVRNTVARVVQTAERLQERFGADNVTVAHARFVDLDRARKDAQLLAKFGPEGERPSRHIVVASQVAEQSLDIDFDILVTDLAPVDLMLQRMGRLHRHLRGGVLQTERPARLRVARCLVTGMEWGETPPRPVAGSIAVYKLYPLLRSLAVLQAHLDGRAVVLPDHISPLVQGAYSKAYEAPPGWEDAMDEARRAHGVYLTGQRQSASAFCLDEVRSPGKALIGWIDGGVGDADDTRAGSAQVRDSPETIEVLVVQRRADGTLGTLPWLGRGLGGLELSQDTLPPPRAARGAAASAIRLPHLFSQPWMFDRVINELEQVYFGAWQANQSPWLAGQLILVLDKDCRTSLAGYELTYDKDNGMEVTLAGERNAKVFGSAASFDLTSRPWLPVLKTDGAIATLSLRDVFAQAESVRRLVGDLPTQEFALLRLLLAILHDALEGPRDTYEWEELWAGADSFAAVPAYLDKFADRFDLLHPVRPFFQVAGLHTEKNDVSSLNKVVADVPNGDPFFTMRMPGVDSLTFAEAARWLVHVHAFDTSGIKSGVVGDPKVVGGKRYPQGVAWLGNLGGVFAEGHNLRETLLLNLIANETSNLNVIPPGDMPAWRREPGTGDVETDEGDETRPTGLRDLYTWQSRRVLLHHDSASVTGVVLTYGDVLTPHNKIRAEPMTGWRRSKPQEKKLNKQPVYMPREHDPSRAAWRGIASLVATSPAGREVQTGEAAPFLRPRIIDWLAELAHDCLPSRSLLRVRTVGAVYGTQQSIIDEVVEDSVAMSVVLLHESDTRFGDAAVQAVTDAESAVNALGDMAADLAAAAGTVPDSQRLAARDRAFGALDGPYRRWLLDLGSSADPITSRAQWQGQVHRIVSDVARVLLDSAGLAAAQGRMVRTASGERWIDDALADLWFRGRLNKALSLRPKKEESALVKDETMEESA